MSANTRDKNRLRLSDFLVVLLCLSITAYSLNLFRLDLFQTIIQQNVKPVGTINIKYNIVQRRLADRALWDRLRVEAPVYDGDLIRTADLSAATLHINGQQLDIEENTLIRIVVDESGAVQVELFEGKLGVATSTDGGLQVIAQGKVITAAPNTSLSATAGNDGFSVQVNEGEAAFGETAFGETSIEQGVMLSFDSKGGLRNDPAAVVTQPRSNAYYVKDTPHPMPVTFAWNRVNISPEAGLRLEIAADRNFTRDVRSVENLNASATVSLEASQWNWRLSYQNTILSSGRLTITDAANVSLLSPANGSLFRYQDDPPLVHFQWAAIEDALYYIIEISQTQDFANPRVRRQTASPSFTDAGLGAGTWHWRVQPVFPSAYEGAASFSQNSFFSVEQTVLASADEAVVPPKPAIVPVEPPPVQNESPPVQPVQQAAITRVQPARQAEGGLPARQAATPRTQNVRQTAIPPPVQQSEAPRAPSVQQTEVQPARQAPMPPPPLLPPPENRQPANGYRIGIEQLKAQRNIVFSWATVPGANGYTITFYEQTANGRQQIQRIPLGNITRWTLEDAGQLGRGTFLWQVEASYSGRSGTVEQPGTPGENLFVIDVPLPEVHMEAPGVLYGF